MARGVTRSMMPPTRKTIVRDPVASTAARRLPGPESSRLMTWITTPARPPRVWAPNPSAPGKAGIVAVGSDAGVGCDSVDGAAAPHPAASNAAPSSVPARPDAARCPVDFNARPRKVQSSSVPPPPVPAGRAAQLLEQDGDTAPAITILSPVPRAALGASAVRVPRLAAALARSPILVALTLADSSSLPVPAVDDDGHRRRAAKRLIEKRHEMLIRLTDDHGRAALPASTLLTRGATVVPHDPGRLKKGRTQVRDALTVGIFRADVAPAPDTDDDLAIGHSMTILPRSARQETAGSRRTIIRPARRRRR